jgi:chromosome segregation ATPase
LQSSAAGAPVSAANDAKVASLKANIQGLKDELSAACAESAGSAATMKELEAERDDLNGELEALRRDKDEADERIEELEKIVEGRADPIAAIDVFLDECERTGPMRFDVPQSERTNRAIVRLHDAVGRQP